MSYTNQTDSRYKFTEKERDLGTNYDYFGARYYDSELGRWQSVDPLASKYPGWSPYNYTKCNPLRFIDPNGMEQGEPGQNGDEDDEGDKKSSWWDKFKKFLNTLVYPKYQEKTEEKDMSPTDNIEPVKTMNTMQKVGQELKKATVKSLDDNHAIVSTGGFTAAAGSKLIIGFPPLSVGLAAISTGAGVTSLCLSTAKWAITGDSKDLMTAGWDFLGVLSGKVIDTALAPNTTIPVEQSQLLRSVFGSSSTIVNYGVSSAFSF
jgi:RHS repeat-associated protein